MKQTVVFLALFVYLATSFAEALSVDTLFVYDSLEISSSRLDLDDNSLSETTSYRKIKVQNSLEKNTISRLLAQTPGVRTRKRGGIGSFQTISIRGTEGKRVAVYLDGVPQMSSLGGAVDLSQFSGLNISSIELYRGFAPAVLGGNSLGGVVNIITNENIHSNRFSFIAGSFGEIEGRASLSRKKDGNILKGTITYHKAENNYPFYSRNGTPYNKDDDFIDTVQNNKFKSFNTSFSYEKELPKDRILSFLGNYETRKRELPSYEGTKPNKTAFWQEEGFSFLTKFNKQFGNGSKLTNTFSYNKTLGLVQWTALDHFRVFFGNPENDEVAKLESNSFIAQNDLTYTCFIGNKLHNLNRLDLKWESVSPKTNQKGYGIGDWESDDFRGKLSSDLHFYGDWGNCFTGATFEGSYSKANEQAEGHNTLQVTPGSDTTFDWALQAGGDIPLFDNSLTLFANVGRFSKLPSLRERFAFQGAVAPNPNLKPESGINSEVGISWKKNKLQTEAVLFHHAHNDLIAFIFDGIIGRSENVGKSKTFGLEQTLIIKPLPWLHVEENLTWQKTQNLSPQYKGNPLPDQPSFDITSKIHIGSIKGFTLIPSCNYHSTIYRDLAKSMAYPNDTTKSGVFHLSTSLRYEKKIVSIELQFLDILDNKVNNTNESGYYTQLYPGRSIQCEVAIKL